MSAVHGTVLLVLALLWPGALLQARSAEPIDTGRLEARWQTYALEAATTQPARDFPHAECFRQAAQTHGLPETLLLAVARGESNFDPAARSRANAIGLMQILWPVTARHLGLQQMSEVLDPCTNVDAGARYLNELLSRYDGDLHRTLAAYNYGPARIPVDGGRLPDGAVWYSAYILRHLDYVLGAGATPPAGDGRPRYASDDRLPVITFARPYRAAAFVDNLQPAFGELRLDWFRRAADRFEVVLLYNDAEERTRALARLQALGFGTG